jgi:hypothetical protein
MHDVNGQSVIKVEVKRVRELAAKVLPLALLGLPYNDAPDRFENFLTLALFASGEPLPVGRPPAGPPAIDETT